MIVYCGNCGKPIRYGDEENCWYCMAPLCFSCWDRVGHCGHPEAERINEAARKHHQQERQKNE